MKKLCTFMALLAVIFLYTGVSNATGLLTEDFSYTAGDTLGVNGGWLVNSGTGPMTIATSGLSYSTLLGSGVGNSINFGVGTQDVYKPLSTTVTTGSIYASLMINVTTMSSTAGDYFFTLGSSTSIFGGKIHVRKDAVSGIDFGLSRQSNTSVTTAAAPVWSTSQSLGTTHFLVLKYTMIAGASNDQVDLWIDPAVGVTEPSATLTSTDGGINSNEITNFVNCFLRQATPGTTSPTSIIDGIKVATTWAEVTPSSTPLLTAAPTSLTGISYITGLGPSASQNYALSGVNLSPASGNITVSASTNFQVSTDDATWSSTSVTVAYTGGTISSVPIYVRLKAGLSIASYGPENIANAGGGATTLNVPVSGTVEPAQQLTCTPNTLTGFLAYFSGSPATTSQSYNLSGTNLTGFPGVITITGSTDYEVSTDNSSFGTSKTVAYSSATLASTPIYVRLKSGLAVGNYNSELVTNAGGGAPTENVTCSGSVVAQTLTVGLGGNVSLSYVLGAGPSGTMTYNVSGANLTGFPNNISVTSPSNFEISTDSISWGSSKTIAYTSGTLASTKVFVRLVGGLAIATYGPGNLSVSGGGATTQNVSLNGFVHATGLQFSDDFDYTVGNLAGQDGWVAHSGAGSNSQQIVSPGLSYGTYIGSGIGNTNSLVGNGEDVNHQFTNITSGSIYASAMINLSSATAAGDYFMHFSDGGTSLFYSRVLAKTSGAGYVLGLIKTSGTGTTTVWSSTVLDFGTTYLIVSKYTFGVSDQSDLFINPALGGSEPAADLTNSTSVFHSLNISGIFFRQSSTTPLGKIDGIRVGQNWSDVAVSGGCTLSLTALFEAMWVGGGETAMPNPAPVTVELHDASTFALVEAQTGTVDVNGAGSFTFTTASSGTPYYIVVKSPTTVETWSANAESFTAGALSYDFTSGVGQAYTDGSMDPMKLYSGKYCIYSGDANQDGFVTSDDFTGIDNDVNLGDYHVENDLNGDLFVTSDDFTFVDNNISLGVMRQVPPGAPSHLVKRAVKTHIQQKGSVN